MYSLLYIMVDKNSFVLSTLQMHFFLLLFIFLIRAEISALVNSL